MNGILAQREVKWLVLRRRYCGFNDSYLPPLQRQRKNLSPAFAFRHIKNLYPIFWEKGQEVVAALTSLTASDPEAIIDVNSWAGRVTLDVIGVAGLGHDFHAIADPNTDLNVTYRRLFSPNRWGRAMGILSFLLPPWILRRLP